MSDAHPREAAIFDAALQLPPEQRGAYLDQTCAGEEPLRQRVEALLSAVATAHDFLNTPAAPPLCRRDAAPFTEKPGDCIGRYKLLQQIGEGGCGVVYMAEQEQPVRRRVALKVIKLGMDTRSVIARFEAERQALAMMDHPNIAKVLDAGATETGRPYFVMELVRGIKITEYCDQNNLTTMERLDLFMQVCRAIQHAHQKGIIHRDVKPSNILVTLHDGLPVPKVIDFGIAKATQGRLTEQTLFTAFQQFIGTPAYMSPEQAEMSGLDIDTRGDIYSLGVLLYELLTGKTPFDGPELLAAGVDAMRQTIREKEPQPPSTRLSTMIAGELIATAKHRQIEAAKLPALVRGDLDWIVMKCLEKDRTRRYETANGLATDIQRHLSHEAVLACPPSRLYRFRKSVRRNRLAFAAGVSVAAALVIGLGVASWMFFKERTALGRAVIAERKQTESLGRALAAEREQIQLRQQADVARNNEVMLRVEAQAARTNEANLRVRAQTEATKSQQVAQFLTDMLQGVGPSVALGRDTTMLKEILDKTAERIGKDLTNQPAVEAKLQSTIGKVYCDLGFYDKAEVLERHALELNRKLWGNEHPSVAKSLNGLGYVLKKQGKLAEAETLFRQALVLSSTEHCDRAVSLDLLAYVLQSQGKLAEAENLSREAVAIWRKSCGDEHVTLANSLSGLANSVGRQGRLAEAEGIHREALAMAKKLLGDDSPDLDMWLSNLAVVLHQQGKLAEAETMFREVLVTQRKVLKNEHPTLALSLYSLAEVIRNENKLAEAETMHREALAMRKKLLGNDHLHVAESLHCLGQVLRKQGKPNDAEEAYREALAVARKVSGNESSGDIPLLGLVLHHLAELLLERTAFTEARTLAEEAVALYQRHADWPLNERQHALGVLSTVLRSVQDFSSLENFLREELAIERKLFTNDHSAVALPLLHLGTVLTAQRKLGEAEILLREALAGYKKLNDHLGVAKSLNNLAFVLFKQGKLAQAETMDREALAMLQKLLGNEHSEAAASLNNLADILHDQRKFSEAESVSREALADARKRYTNNSLWLENPIYRLADSLFRQGKYAEAEPLIREMLQSVRSRLPGTNNEVVSLTAGLARLLAELAWSERGSKSETAERGREAERLLRDCLAIRNRTFTNHLPVAETQSRLGFALVAAAVTDRALAPEARLAKLTEAESFLHQGNETLQQSQKVESKYKRDALERFVRLYEAWDQLSPNSGKAAKVAEWKKKLIEFDQGEAKEKEHSRQPEQ